MRTGTDRARRLGGDDGAVVVEAALVLPLLFLLVCGVVDFGIGLRAQSILQTATRNAARSGAAAVANTTADRLILSTLQAGVQSTTALKVKEVVVYKVPNAASNGKVTTACANQNPTGLTTKGVAGVCNAYSQQMVNVAANNPGSFQMGGATCAASAWDRWWCPRDRLAVLAGTVDSLGVYVEATYTPYTDVFGTGDFAMTDYIVMKLEPLPG